MRPTRRYWALATTSAALALLAPVFDRSLLLVGAAAVGGLLLGRQYAFLRAVRALDDDLTVDIDATRDFVTEDESVPVTLAVGGLDTDLDAGVTANVPASADGPAEHERHVTVESTDETTTFEVTFPVVGRVTLGPATVAVESGDGLFTERFERGPAPEVTVEPRRPRRLHVGEGGEQVAATFGEHTTGNIGTGLDPAELRQYVPGDSAGDIDWKATARLDEAYVREHEVETDRRSLLLFDHRERLGEGPAGERKLDYLREVAVALAGQARELDDPLGLYTVGDAGLTAEFAPATDPGQYRAIHDRLQDLDPTAAADARTGADATDADSTAPTAAAQATVGPGEAHRASARLAGDDSAFGATLQPYLDDAGGYVSRIEGDPLFATVRTHVTRLGGTTWTFLFSNDGDRARLREAVKLARGEDGHVVVFLAPDVLFERGGLGDLEAAYERYVDFEEFRRTLARMDRVSAYEVGPGDRVDAVLGQRRNQNT